MTAFVAITRYGRATQVVCLPCRLRDPYGRDHRAAATAAAVHNADMHPAETP